MIVMALVVVGAAGYFKLGGPHAASGSPSALCPPGSGRLPREMESLVAQPIEEVVNTVAESPSSARFRARELFHHRSVRFARNVNVAAEDVRTQAATVVPDLPRERTRPSSRNSTAIARRDDGRLR
jgi:hypothetical protein